ncbi:MAG: hypothetical protein ACE5EA_04220 [Nitrospirota bacterium]
MQGPEIADKLNIIDPQVKVIVLTRWRTWGILDTHCDEQSSAKLVIGKVEIDTEEIPTYKRDPKQKFVPFEEFERLKKEVLELKKAIQELKNIVRKRNPL